MHAVILHGTMSTPDNNWFPWLKSKLEAKNIEVFVPTLPTPENQSKESWCNALNNQAPIFGEDTLLIGHSCGANHVLHVLESMDKAVAYAGLIGCVTEETGVKDIDKLNDTFIHHDFDWKKIRRNAKHFTILHGDDDPYVPLAQPLALSRNLNVPLTILPKGGHLNAEAGYTTFDFLYEDITKHL